MGYGARARAGGTCLVAVSHAASVIGCGVCASGAVRCITITLATPAAHPQHPMTLGACAIQLYLNPGGIISSH